MKRKALKEGICYLITFLLLLSAWLAGYNFYLSNMVLGLYWFFVMIYWIVNLVNKYIAGSKNE